MVSKPQYVTPEYRAALQYWEPRMRDHGWTCRRCAHPIPAGDRKAWDLGHEAAAKHGGNGGFEPEHRACNRAGGAALTNGASIGASADWW